MGGINVICMLFFFFYKILLSGSIKGANHSVMVIEYTLGVQ